MLSNQNPSMLYRLIDSWGNNHIWGFIYKNYIRQLGFEGNERILDFGSGSGAGSRHLAQLLQKRGGRLTCCDISEYWMNVAQKRLKKYKNVEFERGQLTELHLKQSSFDIVYIHFTLHEVPGELRLSIVREFYRLLKPGGRLCIKEPKREGDGMPAAEIQCLMVKSGFKEKYQKNKKRYYQGVYVKPEQAAHD